MFTVTITLRLLLHRLVVEASTFGLRRSEQNSVKDPPVSCFICTVCLVPLQITFFFVLQELKRYLYKQLQRYVEITM